MDGDQPKAELETFRATPDQKANFLVAMMTANIIVMGPGQKFLTQVRLSQFFVAWVRLG